MRLIGALCLTGLAIAPAAAAPKPQPKVEVVVPPGLSDPAMADKLGRMAGALAKAMMDLPVGEIEAAAEGRAATPADKARKVRDVADIDDKRLAEQAAGSGQAVQAATRALVASLPAILASLQGAGVELEKAVANLPDPTYPKR